jgi:hypothetical protein
VPIMSNRRALLIFGVLHGMVLCFIRAMSLGLCCPGQFAGRVGNMSDKALVTEDTNAERLWLP